MNVSTNYLLRFLAGAVFGLYMAHLLFFLNPQLEVSPGRLAQFGIAYAVLCGAIFGSILWAAGRLTFRWSEQEKDRRGFGFTVVAVFIATLVYWAHLSALRIYLPRGAVRILSKATSILAATAFVLFILWIVERTAPRRVRRTIGVIGLVVVLASSLFLYQRREGYRTDPRVPVVANVGAITEDRHLIVIAMRNLPHDWVVRLKGEGVIPSLATLTERGFFTRIEPFRTTSPKALWASLATGKLPHRHGVTGRFSYETALNRGGDPFLIVPNWVGFRAWGLIPPVKRISAQLPAGSALPFWGMVDRLGVGSKVLNWPGTIVAAKESREQIPQRLKRMTADTRLHEAIAADLSAASRAQELASEKSEMLTVVSLNALADIQTAVESSGELHDATTAAGELIRAYLAEIDRAIGQIASAAPDATLIVVSPTGVDPPPLPASPLDVARSLRLMRDPGRDDGFLILRGRGVVHRDNPAAAEVVDVVPTALFSVGLPVSRDMDGRLLTEAFQEEFLVSNPLSIIQTYETERLITRRNDVSDHRVSH